LSTASALVPPRVTGTCAPPETARAPHTDARTHTCAHTRMDARTHARTHAHAAWYHIPPLPWQKTLRADPRLDTAKRCPCTRAAHRPGSIAHTKISARAPGRRVAARTLATLHGRPWAGAWLLARWAGAGARGTHGSRIEYFRIKGTHPTAHRTRSPRTRSRRRTP